MLGEGLSAASGVARRDSPSHVGIAIMLPDGINRPCIIDTWTGVRSPYSYSCLFHDALWSSPAAGISIAAS